MATCFHHHGPRDRARLHPLRAARVSRLPHPGRGRIAVLRVRPRRRARRARCASARRIERDPLIATKLHRSRSTSRRFVLISLRDRDDQRQRAHRVRPRPHRAVPAERRVVAAVHLLHRALRAAAHRLQHARALARRQEFEPGTGPMRFATLYFVSVLGGAAGALIATPDSAHRRRERRHLRRRRGGHARDAPPRHPLLGHRLRAAARPEPRRSASSIAEHLDRRSHRRPDRGRARRGGDDAGAQDRDARARLRRPRARRPRVGRGRVRGRRARTRHVQPLRDRTSSTAPVSSSSTSRKPHCSASAARPSRGPLASTSSPASSVMRPRGR